MEEEHRTSGNGRGDGPSVSPHNMPEGGNNKPSTFQHRGSRSVEEYRRLEQIGEGQYGQVMCYNHRRLVLTLTCAFKHTHYIRCSDASTLSNTGVAGAGGR